MAGKSRPRATAYEPVIGYPVLTGYPVATNDISKTETIFILKVFFVIIIFGLIALICVIVSSILPQISVFHVSSLVLSNFDTSTFPSFITGNWDMVLIVKNTDEKLTLSYQKINATVLYNDVLIVKTTLPEFDLAKKNQTVVSGRLATAGANVNTWVVDDISKDRSNGRVKFDIELEAYVQYKRYIFDPQLLEAKIYCAGLELGLTEAAGNASLVGKGERECVVTCWGNCYNSLNQLPRHRRFVPSEKVIG